MDEFYLHTNSNTLIVIVVVLVGPSSSSSSLIDNVYGAFMNTFIRQKAEADRQADRQTDKQTNNFITAHSLREFTLFILINGEQLQETADPRCQYGNTTDVGRKSACRLLSFTSTGTAMSNEHVYRRIQTEDSCHSGGLPFPAMNG